MCEGTKIEQFKGNDGIYLAYFTAEFGTTMGMFTFKGGTICGADLGGGIYDGTLELAPETGDLYGEISFRMKDGGTTITGASSDLPVCFDIPVRLKMPVDKVDFHKIDTPNGPINVRFERIRSI